MKEDDENDGVDVSADKDPLRILASLTPKFLGTLRLEGATPSGTDVDINTIASGSATIVPPPEGEAKDEYMALTQQCFFFCDLIFVWILMLHRALC